MRTGSVDQVILLQCETATMFIDRSVRDAASRRRLLARAVVLAALIQTVAGCAASPLGQEAVGVLEEDTELHASVWSVDASAATSAVRVTDADGGVLKVGTGAATPSVMALVAASGSGCPAGSWGSERLGSGALETRFRAFQASVDAKRTAEMKACELNVRLHGAVPLSFALTEAQYEGYAQLEPGVVARQTSVISYQGQVESRMEGRTELNGPHDAAYRLTDRVRVADARWSTCTTDLDVIVRLTLVVRSDEQKRAGSMKVEKMPELRLVARPCAR